jgi:pumilio RNA-binding family
MPHDAIDFIVRAVTEHKDTVSKLCVHTYGCRVIQRILENCEESQTQPILDAILADLNNLTNDQFGNYVVQHILEQGRNVEDKNKIVKSIKGKVIELSNHKYASNVVEKCLAHGSETDRREIIEEILRSNNYDLSEEITGGQQLNGALYAMMKDRYGNYVIQKCIEVS